MNLWCFIPLKYWTNDSITTSKNCYQKYLQIVISNCMYDVPEGLEFYRSCQMCTISIWTDIVIITPVWLLKIRLKNTNMFQIAIAYVIIMDLHRIYVDQVVRKD